MKFNEAGFYFFQDIYERLKLEWVDEKYFDRPWKFWWAFILLIVCV